MAENGDVRVPVAVHVERVRAGHALEIGLVVGEVGEGKGAAGRAVVAVQGCGTLAAGEEELVPSVAIAVEYGDATADEEVRFAVIPVVNPGRSRLVHEPRRGQRSTRRVR